VYFSGYTYSQLRPLIAAILSCCEDPARHHAAIFEKYADKRFRRASTFVETIMRKGFSLPAVPRPSLPSNDAVMMRARMEAPRKQVEVYA
jgi:G2/mitotic-specific cyclin 3/4